jgi:hypothetical protein
MRAVDRDLIRGGHYGSGRVNRANLIPFPYQIDFAMYGNDVMDLTSAGLRSM